MMLGSIMKERWKKIRTGLFIILFTVIGLLEYAQLMKSFDLPQVVLVMPLVGALTMITLRKWSFLVPVLTIAFSCMYQITAGNANAIYELRTNATSVAIVLLECLSVLIIFEAIGIGGGALIRVLINKNRKFALGIICCVLGVLVTLGPYLAIFHNPLYPITARMDLKQRAGEQFTDYAIADIKVYYSLQASTYVCRVSMSDGEIRMIYDN